MTAASAAAAMETPVDIPAVAVEDVEGFAISGKQEPVTEEIIADFCIRMEAAEIKDTEETKGEDTEGIGTRAAAAAAATAAAAAAAAAASVSTGKTTAHAPLAIDVGFPMAMQAARAAAVAVGRVVVMVDGQAAVAVAVVAADPKSATTGNAEAAHMVTNAASSIPVPAAAPRMAAWKPARAATNFFNSCHLSVLFVDFLLACLSPPAAEKEKEKVNKVQKK